jgi:TonB family protein
MKFSPLLLRLVPLVFSATVLMKAADAPAAAKNGYTVTVDVKVNETGAPESASIFSSEDTTTGHILDKMALAMAAKAQFPPNVKDGKPAKFTAREPYFFGIEDDEGAEANKAPKPTFKTHLMPVYPPALREQGVVGGSVVEIVVDAEGKLVRVTPLRSSHPEMEASAIQWVNGCTFAPALKDGKPVESRWRMAVVFETETKMTDLKWRVAPRPNLGTFVVIRPNHPINAEGVDTTAPATSGQAPEAPVAPAPAPTAEPAK